MGGSERRGACGQGAETAQIPSVTSGVVGGAELGDGWLEVRTTDLEGFGRLLPRVAREAGVSLFEASPTDESLESVFAYLVQR